MFTAKQYRAKAAEFTELLKTASLPAEIREFRKLEHSYLTLAENEEWMADNLEKINSPGADENWYGDAILARQGKHTGDFIQEKFVFSAHLVQHKQSSTFVGRERSATLLAIY